jgi:hypothetical protein
MNASLNQASRAVFVQVDDTAVVELRMRSEGRFTLAVEGEDGLEEVHRREEAGEALTCPHLLMTWPASSPSSEP